MPHAQLGNADPLISGCLIQLNSRISIKILWLLIKLMIAIFESRYDKLFNSTNKNMNYKREIKLFPVE